MIHGIEHLPVTEMSWNDICDALHDGRMAISQNLRNGGFQVIRPILPALKRRSKPQTPYHWLGAEAEAYT